MSFAPGDVFDRYEIEALLGEGGMGRVYRALDTRLHRKVALKIVRPAGPGEALPESSADSAARMLREARAAAALAHPNLVSIFDVGEISGTTYLAMELIEGKTLRAYVPPKTGESPVPVERRVRWLLDVARALAAAHRRGLVHRDIKPENVMVRDDDGAVKVLDFGIARHVTAIDPTAATEGAATPAGTMTGNSLVGTPMYMAPEQMRRETIDGRTDQLAWGVVAYELLSGVLPWGDRENAFLVVANLLSNDFVPRPLSELVPDLPAGVESTVMRALQKVPSRRFPTMDELVASLEPAVSSDAMRSPAAIHVATLRSPDPAAQGEPTERVAAVASTHGGPGSYGTSPTGAMIEQLARPATPVIEPRAANVRASGPRVWRLRAIVAVVIASGLVAFLLVRRPVRPAPRGDGPPIASASGKPVPITSLPRPTSTSPDALAAYQEGLQALRDATWDVAVTSFERAVKLDPALAAAHLRLAIVKVWIASPTVARESFQRAAQLRASLPEHEQVLLDALSPYVQGTPSDPVETEKRLREASARTPNDVELLGWLALILGAQQKFEEELTVADRAVSLDPQYADGWDARANALARVGRFDEAKKSLDACIAVSPSAADCLWHLIGIREQQGECAQIEQDAIRWLATQPKSASGYHELSKALLALGHPRATVEEALRQKWQNLADGERAKAEATDRMHLSILEGDFIAAEVEARKLLAIVEPDPNEFAHAAPTRTLVDVQLETGRFAAAGALASEFLRRKNVWVGSVFSSIAMDASLQMVHAELRARMVDEATFEKARKLFLDAWAPRIPPRFHGLLWLYGWARVSDTEAEAKAALAALPSYGALPSFRPRTLAGEDVGRVYYLADHDAEAIPELQHATRSCRALDDPLDHTRAHAYLGFALEETHDTKGACEAFAVVLSRWGNAKPRSVTAEEVAAHAKSLGCPPPPPPPPP
jgi:tetratricopeptide (TPR) repeat protein